jgi:hypothetical protein
MRLMTLVCWMGIPLMNQQKMRMQHLMMTMRRCSNQADVEDPTSSTVYDAYDEGSSSMITPTHDEDSTPYLIYDVDDDEDVIVP